MARTRTLLAIMVGLAILESSLPAAQVPGPPQEPRADVGDVYVAMGISSTSGRLERFAADGTPLGLVVDASDGFQLYGTFCRWGTERVVFQTGIPGELYSCAPDGSGLARFLEPGVALPWISELGANGFGDLFLCYIEDSSPQDVLHLLRVDESGRVRSEAVVGVYYSDDIYAVAFGPDGGGLVALSSKRLLRFDRYGRTLTPFATGGWVGSAFGDLAWEPATSTWLGSQREGIRRISADGLDLGLVFTPPAAGQNFEVVRDGTLLLETSSGIARFSAGGALLGTFLDGSGIENFVTEIPMAPARGVIRVNPPVPGCAQQFEIVVLDSGGNTTPGIDTLQVQVTSSLEVFPEVVALVEDAPTSARFRGTIPLSTTDGVGILRVAPGGSISVTYQDPDGGGGPVSVVDSTTVAGDCTAPVISGLAVTRVLPDRYVVEWVTDEPATSIVEHGPGAGGLLPVGSATFSTSHRVEVTGVPACTEDRFRVVSADRLGNAGVDDAGGSLHRVRTTAADAIFVADFEAGGAGWESGGGLGPWEFGTPTAGPGAAHGGVAVAATDLDEPLCPTSCGEAESTWLASPAVFLPTVGGTVLTFSHWYEFGGSLWSSDDGGWLELSTDGGITWSWVEPEAGGYTADGRQVNDPIWYAFGAWTEASDGWSDVRVDLTRYEGAELRFRFHMVATEAWGTGHRAAGWFLDDLRIEATAACGPFPKIRSWSLSDAAHGDGDGRLEPGEVARIGLRVENAGEEAATSIAMTAAGLPGVEVLDASAFLGALAPGAVTTEGVAWVDVFAAAGDPCDSPFETDVEFLATPASGPAVESRGRISLLPGLAHHPVRVGTWRGANLTGAPATYCGAGSSYSSGAADPTPIFSRGSAGQIEAVELQSLDFALLEPLDVILLRGAAVPDRWLADVEAWFRPGKTIVATGWATCTLAFTGWMWPLSAGDDGFPSAWRDSSFLSETVLVDDPITSAYGAGAVIAWGSTPNWLWTGATASPELIPPDAVALLRLTEDPSRISAAYRDVPGRGRVVFLGLYSNSILEGEEILRAAATTATERTCESPGLLDVEVVANGCSGVIRVEVRDPDRNLQPAVAETIAATVDSAAETSPESLLLLESGPDSGRFEGAIPMGLADAAGVLVVAPGDAVVVRYDDPLGPGGARTYVETRPLAGDCTPPVVTARSRVEVAPGIVEFRWQTDEPAEGRVEFGLHPSLTRSTREGRHVEDHQVAIGRLEPCRTWVDRTASTDPSGNLALDDNGGQLYSWQTNRDEVVYVEGFESGTGGWTKGTASEPWDFGVPIGGPDGAFEGNRLCGTGLHGRLQYGWNGTLTSPSILLPDSPAALTFFHWFEVEGYDGGYLRKGVTLEIQAESGEWTPVAPIGGYPVAVTGPLSWTGFLAGGWWSGTSRGWIPSAFDLSRWRAQRIRLRFRLLSNSYGSGDIPRWGYFFDDVRVSVPASCGPWPVPTAPTVVAAPFGDSDAVAEPGERVDLAIPLHNIGTVAATTVGADMTSGASGITIRRGSASYPDLAAGSSGSPVVPYQLDLDASIPCGSRVRLDLSTRFSPAGSLGTTGSFPVDLRVGRRDTTISVGIVAASEAVSYVDWYSYSGAGWLSALLAADPSGRFSVTTLSSLSAANLAPIEILVVADRAVPDVWLDEVEAWFGPGKTILASGTMGAAYGAFSGFLWPAGRGSNGRNVEWLSSSGSVSYPTFTLVEPVPGYDAGEVFPLISSLGEQAVEARVPADARIVLRSNLSPPRVDAIWRDVPGRGRIIFIGSMSMLPYPTEGVLRELVASDAGWTCDVEGRVRLDLEQYRCSSPVTITVTDPFANQLPGTAETVTAVLSSGSDPAGEVGWLFETGVSTGVFVGQLALAAASGAGQVAVSPGDELEVSYVGRDALGSPMEFQDRATVMPDCTGPVVSGLSVVVGSRAARVTWATDERAMSMLEWGYTCNPPAESVPSGGFRTSHEVVLEGLLPSTTYRYRVRSVDPLGNESVSESAGSCFTFTTGAPDRYLYVLESGGAVNRVNLSGTSIRRVRSGSVGSAAHMDIDAKNRIFLGQSGELRRMDEDGFGETVLHSGSWTVKDVSVAPDGKIWVLDSEPVLRRFDAEGTLEATLPVPYNFPYPWSVTFRPDGYFVVADLWQSAVMLFRSNGTFDRVLVDWEDGLLEPVDALWDPSTGTWLVADYSMDKIWRVTDAGTLSDTLIPANYPSDLEWHPDGRLLINQYGKIYAWNFATSQLSVFASSTTGVGSPLDLEVSSILPTSVSARQATATFDDRCALGGPGNDNGILDFYEASTLVLGFENDGNVRLTGVTAVASLMSGPVSVTDSFAVVPALSPGVTSTTSAPHLEVTAAGQCGTARLAITLGANEGGPWSSIVEIPIGETSPTAVTVLSEGFSSGIPGGWTVTNGGSISTTWTTTNTCGRTPGAPIAAPFAIVDSACSVISTFNDQLASPQMNLSQATSATLSVDHWFNYKAGGNSEKASIEVRSSATGGVWLTLRLMNSASSPNPEHLSFDLSPSCAGTPDCQVRFSYVDAKGDGWWIVDNVVVTAGVASCSSQPCTFAAIPPPPVADGTGGAAMKVSERPGGVLQVTWPTTPCFAGGYELLSSPLAGSFVPSEGVCALPASGELLWTPAAKEGDLAFLVVATDGESKEGSWGRDSAGGHVGGAVPSGRCGMSTRDNSGTCP